MHQNCTSLRISRRLCLKKSDVPQQRDVHWSVEWPLDCEGAWEVSMWIINCCRHLPIKFSLHAACVGSERAGPSITGRKLYRKGYVVQVSSFSIVRGQTNGTRTQKSADHCIIEEILRTAKERLRKFAQRIQVIANVFGLLTGFSELTSK